MILSNFKHPFSYNLLKVLTDLPLLRPFLFIFVDNITITRYNRNMKTHTTKEVYEAEGCSKFTATTWAKKNHVKKFGTVYRWTEANFRRFKRRNKQKGAPRGHRECRICISKKERNCKTE